MAMRKNTVAEYRDGPFAYLADEEVRQYLDDRARLDAAIDEVLAADIHDGTLLFDVSSLSDVPNIVCDHVSHSGAA
jgi:hypothetical protein